MQGVGIAGDGNVVSYVKHKKFVFFAPCKLP